MSAELTPTEFRLLHALALEAGRVVTPRGADAARSGAGASATATGQSTSSSGSFATRSTGERPGTRSSTRATGSATSSRLRPSSGRGPAAAEGGREAAQPRALADRLERARPRAGVRPRACRCSSGSSTARSSRRTWTSSSPCASPGLLDQAASGLNVRSDDGRSPKATLAEIRTRVEELSERQARLWSRELCSRARRGGDRHRPRRGLHRAEERDELARALPPGDLPGADPARGRPGPAVPVHLGALAQPRRLRPRPGDGRGATGAREGARGAAPLPRGRRQAACSSRSRT